MWSSCRRAARHSSPTYIRTPETCVKELGLESPFLNRTLRPDELVEAVFIDHAGAAGILAANHSAPTRPTQSASCGLVSGPGARGKTP